MLFNSIHFRYVNRYKFNDQPFNCMKQNNRNEEMTLENTLNIFNLMVIIF